MKIRIAALPDVPQLSKLVNGAYRGENSRKGWTTEADILDGIRTSETSLAEMVNQPHALILLAEEEQNLMGCVYLEQQDDTMYLGMLTVEPELQGKGLGAGLMNVAEEKAKTVGCKKMKMTVITVRETLIAYYERKGYKDTGEREAFPTNPKFGVARQPLEFMVMEKSLV